MGKLMPFHSGIEGASLSFLLLVQIVSVFVKNTVEEIGTEKEVCTPECNEGVDILLFDSASLSLEKSLRVVYVCFVKVLDLPFIGDDK